jgi:hypothetical protein
MAAAEERTGNPGDGVGDGVGGPAPRLPRASKYAGTTSNREVSTLIALCQKQTHFLSFITSMYKWDRIVFEVLEHPSKHTEATW